MDDEERQGLVDEIAELKDTINQNDTEISSLKDRIDELYAALDNIYNIARKTL